MTGDSICFHFYTSENKLGQTVLGKEILSGPYKNLSLLFRGGRVGKPIIKESLKNWENCQGNSEKTHYSVPGYFCSSHSLLPIPQCAFFKNRGDVNLFVPFHYLPSYCLCSFLKMKIRGKKVCHNFGS